MPNDAYDISIRINNGDHNGEVYNFMLAEDSNRLKEWHLVKLNNKPPLMTKHFITAVITARDDQMVSSGIMESKRASLIMEEINRISDSTDSYAHCATLTGFDGLTYHIVIDMGSPEHRAMVHEGEFEPEYQVVLKMWSIYT